MRLMRGTGRTHEPGRTYSCSGRPAQVAAARAAAAADADAQARALAGRIWLPPTLRARLDDAWAQAIARLDQFALRLQAARDGYVALPLKDAEPAEAPPPPVALEPALP